MIPDSGKRSVCPRVFPVFSFVMNNPTNQIDPLGLVCTGDLPNTNCNNVSGVAREGGFGGTGAGSFQFSSIPVYGWGMLPDGESYDWGLLGNGLFITGAQGASLGTQSLGGITALEQKQLQALKACIKDMYSIDLRTFVPIAPDGNGYFYGLSSQGSVTVETNVTHSAFTLGLDEWQAISSCRINISKHEPQPAQLRSE